MREAASPPDNPPRILSHHSPRFAPILALVFVISTALAYVTIPPINHLDWVTTAQFIRYMTELENPYEYDLAVDPDLEAYYDGGYEYLPYSPWTLFYFGVLAYATTRLIVALSVAAWIVIMIDSGRPLSLLLVLHPTFLMLIASGNIDFLVNGVGLWLVLRGSRGWRMGVAIMLMAVKPQVLPLLILLETARALWERDRGALLTMAGIAGLSLLLFPRWLEWPVDTLASYLDVVRGVKTADEVKFGGGYPFSVFGAWGFFPAAGVTLAILALMWRRRLTEWRTLAVALGYVWTTYVNPYSYAVLLILFRKAPAWRVLLYLGISLASLPVFFTEWHRYERYGILLFLLLAVALTPPEPEQTEQAIAARRGVAVLPPVRWLMARRKNATLAPVPGDTQVN